jgi:hypothetical protein
MELTKDRLHAIIDGFNEHKNEYLNSEIAKIKDILENFGENERLSVIRLESIIKNISMTVESKETLKSLKTVVEGVYNS